MTKNFDNFFNSIVERAMHSSPHYISDKFDLKYVSTGEGNATFGYGLYFTNSPDVLKSYTDKFKYVRGHEKIYNYTVDIHAKEEELLDYDVSFEEQSEYVKKIVKPLVELIRSYSWKEYSDGRGSVVDDKGFPVSIIPAFDKNDLEEYQKATGKNIYEFIQSDYNSAKKASRMFWEAGIKGMKYLTGFDRHNTNSKIKAHNYVIFDDSIIEIYDYDEISGVEADDDELLENTSADVFGTSEPYDTSDARTPFVIGTFNRRGKVKKKRKKRKIVKESEYTM